MKTNAAIEALLASVRPKIIQRDGYTVRIIFPFAVRYEAGGKILTLAADVKQKDGSWWVFGSYLAVTVEVPICWDNEDEPMGVGEAEVVMSRIKEVLDKSQGKHYKFEPIQMLDRGV